MQWQKVVSRTLEFGQRVLATEVSTVEAAGLLHAVASVGTSFEPSLLPRTTIQQAGITGVVASVNYGLTATNQSFIEAFARRVVGTRTATHEFPRAATLAAGLATLGASAAIRSRLEQRSGESVSRAATRTTASRVSYSATAGVLAVAADGIADAVTGRHTSGTVSAPLVVSFGAALGAGLHLLRRRRLLDTAATTDQYGSPVRPASSVDPLGAAAVGVGVSVGLYGLSRAESLAADTVATVVGWAVPGLKPVGKAIGHATTLGLFGFLIERGIASAYEKADSVGGAMEPAYRAIPTSDSVSGGPGSLIDWASIGREGRRFVNMALSSDEIQAVTDQPAVDPIRVFVGFESAESPNSRAYTAMEELDRLGAFDRPYVAVFSPTGSGYVNYVAAETIEYLTGGNVASACVQYSVRPSALSLDRVGTAWQSNLALLTALAWRIRAIPEGSRPKILLFGESLGAQSAQDVFENEGVRGFDILDVSRALFVGSPYASKWRQRWLADPAAIDPNGYVVEVNSLADLEALDPDRRARARVFLLSHYLDPIPKFGATLAVQRPYWLGDPENRPPGVPEQARWWPLFTFLLVGVDLLNAEHVVPGKFEAYGHDYRQDLPAMTKTAFDLPGDDAMMERIERALRQRELEWAERRLFADTFEKAEQSVRDKLEGWGVDHTIIPGITTPTRDVAPDPYAAGATP
ncbi:MAG: alpha/beta-hydrolase family protein [Candidatus Nanopelagicales bacterium]|nr:alpha/beta-hydrolase family protein [Candidatus Nanopelagicales bacterium]MDZ4248594.1 alpha/beta-hydrolase family protein [Candidatus Nanopelagicales bacterium]